MTRRMIADVECATCGAASSQDMLLSTNTSGHYDLDLRPPPMKRDTMELWLHECPACGFIAADISEAEPMIKEAMASPEWAAMRAETDASPLALRFRRRAALDLLRANAEHATDHLLCAAWTYDDANQPQQAAALRRRVAGMMEATLAGVTDPDDLTERRVRLVDILRRAGEWQRASALCAELDRATLRPPLDAIIAFHKERIRAHDAAGYTVGDATKAD